MKYQSVLVTGASGFVGRHVVQALLTQGYRVTCLLRPYSNREHLDSQDVRVCEGDILDVSSMDGAFDSIDAVIHLVGIIREYKRNMFMRAGAQREVRFARTHIEGVANVITCAKRARVKKIIHMSALGVSESSASAYKRTKWAGEQVVAHSGMDYTIFRPSLIYGEGGEFVQIMRDLINTPFVTPVAGRGHNLVQPVFVEDVAKCFVHALGCTSWSGHAFNLGGPDQMTFDHLVDSLTRALGKRKIKLHIPLYLMSVPATLLEWFHPMPMITRDQLLMLKDHNICVDGEMEKMSEEMDWTFTRFSEWLKQAFEK